MAERYVENKELILELKDFKDISDVISCGPMELRTINLIERQNLTNNHCIYLLSSAHKVGNPFSIICIRNLSGKAIYENKMDGKKRSYRIVCIIDDNLYPLFNQEDFIQDDVDLNGETKHIEGFKQYKLSEDDFKFIIDEYIMEEASLIIDRINSLYLLHGEDDYKDILYDAYK